MTASVKVAAAFALIVLWANYATLVQETSFDSNHIRHRPVAQAAQAQWATFLGEPLVRASGFDAGEQARQRVHHQPQAVHQLRGAPLVMPANNQLVPAHNEVAQQPAGGFGWPDSVNLKQQTSGKQATAGNQQHRKAGASAYQGESSAPGGTSNLMSANFELALRQANGDESVFQPSPALGASNQDAYESVWSGQLASQQPQLGSASAEKSLQEGGGTFLKSANRPGGEHRSLEVAPTPPPPPMSTVAQTATTVAEPRPTTTELNNLVAGGHEPAVMLSHQQSVSNHQKEYQASLMNGSSTSLEFNNQVIYEGPATPPSAASSDDNTYYLSSSSLPALSNSAGETLAARDHNNEPPAGAPSSSSAAAAAAAAAASLSHSNAWWALGLEDELERTGNLSRADYLDYCDRSPLLINSKQRSLCRLHPRVLSIVGRGLRMAMHECQAKFAASRWNCSLIVHSSTPLHNADSNNNNNIDRAPAVFGRVMRRPNRERSFLNAIIAAGLAHAMTRACSQGELPEECSCDRKIKARNNRGRIEWVACSDDIDFGARFSREFTDNFDPAESDATATIYMHNSEVGRRVFKSATDITCTCSNGDNGLCQMKRCWKHLGPYADVVDELIKRYEGATHVQRSSKDPHKLRPVRRGVRKPKRKDLVYIEESPDYCQSDSRFGVLGTQNRLCNSTSQGSDSCSLLCCGRGFQSVAEQIEEDCNCKFVWCCQVKCSKCKRFVTKDICN